jgi:site-specific DNA recombinase
MPSVPTAAVYPRSVPFAADELMTADATSILTRRVKQGVSEWYVRDLIERAAEGWRRASARDGTQADPSPTDSS